MLSDLGRALAGGDRLELLETASVPDEPGLYAWWADRPGAAPDLGLTDAGAERPLYVGWARSLRRRIEEHLSPPHQQRSGSPLRAGLAQSLMMVRGVVPAHEGLSLPGTGASTVQTSVGRAHATSSPSAASRGG